METRFDGIEVNLNGRKVVPPLSLRWMRNNGEIIKRIQANASSLDSLDSPEAKAVLDDIVTVIHAAVVRNYPDVQRDDLEEWIDLGTLPKVFMAVLKASGVGRGAAQSGKSVEAEVK